jgi:hypothetical protein
MNAETRNISVPLDQPYRALNVLRSAIQQKLVQSQPLPPAFPAQRVVIVDSDSIRVQQIARLIVAAGYQPFITNTTLTAFTHYLQGSFVPLVIILTEDSGNDALVLLGLQRQVQQKYHWNIPFIRIQAQLTSNSSMQQAETSASLLSPRTPTPHVDQSGVGTGRVSGLPSRSPLAQTHLQSFRPMAEPDKVLENRTGPLTTSRSTNVLVEAPHDLKPGRTGPLPPQNSPLQHPPNTPTAHRKYRPAPSISAIPTGPLPAPSNAHLLVENPAAETIIEIREIKKENLEGQNLGRFQIKERLGGTLLGDVYKAYDRLRETDIALKSIQRTVLPDDFLSDAYVNTNFFQQEIDMLTDLKHPHIYPAMNAGKSYISGTPFYYKTMPLSKAGSLATWRFEHGNTKAFPWQEVLPIALQLGEALQFVHDHKLVYQNFKLTNILLEGQVKDNLRHLHVSLADFMLTGDNSHPLHTPESLLYLAPEQWNGTALPASDQYGLAALLYELLTGRPPFPGNQEQLLRHMHFTMQPQSPRTFNPTITPMVDKLLLRALSKNPRDRFATIAIFAHRLRQGE